MKPAAPNLFFHLLKKDCRRFGLIGLLWVAAWVVIVIAGVHGDRAALPGLSAIILSVRVIFGILTAMLAAGVILEDPAVGTTAFWLSRPFGRGLIVGEKLFFLAGIAAIPALIDVAIMAFAGAPPPVLALGVLQKSLLAAPFILALAAFAVTAETYGRWAIHGILILVASGIAAAIWFTTFRFERPSGFHVSSPTYLASKMIAVELIVLAAAIGILIWRYFRRHARSTLVVVALAAFVSMLAAAYWSWDFLSVGSAPGAPTVESPTVREISGRFNLEQSSFAVTVSAPGVQDANGEVEEPLYLSDASLSWPDGSISKIGNKTAFSFSLAANEPQTLAKAVAPVAILNLPGRADPTGQLFLSWQDQARLRRESAHIRGRVAYSVGSLSVEAEIPLRAGARVAMGLRDVEVSEVGWIARTSAVGITLREKYYPSVFAPQADQGSLAQEVTVVGSAPRPRIFLLVNKRRGEAMIAMIGGTAGGTASYGGYVVDHCLLTAFGHKLSADWVRDASLVILQWRPAGGSVAAPVEGDVVGAE